MTTNKNWATPTGFFGSAPIRQEGSAVSYDDSLLVATSAGVMDDGTPYTTGDLISKHVLKAVTNHAVSVDIDADTITLTEEEQND